LIGGHRFEDASVEWLRLGNFSLDSRQARERVSTAAAGRNEINAAAVRLGQAIAQSVLDVARRQNWPGASR
jgi:hypothetical protein